MLKPVAAMALSLSLVTLAAGPALAQARRPAAEPQPVRATAAPATLSVFAKPQFEFSLLGGFRLMTGWTLQAGSTTQTDFTNQLDSSNPATPPVTSNRVTKSNASTSDSERNLLPGFSLSGSATYWLDDSFGLGLDYVYARSGSRVDHAYSLGLAPATITLDADPANGTQTSTTGQTARISILGNIYNVGFDAISRGNPGTADYKEFAATTLDVSPLTALTWTMEKRSEVGLPVGARFITTEAAIPENTGANAPTNKFTAAGKLSGSQDGAISLSMIDALTKTVIGATPRGELHLLTGVTVPVSMFHDLQVSALTGPDGAGAATQTVEHKDPADAGNDFTQVTSVESTNRSDTFRSNVMVGPMIGLGGTFKLSNALGLYGKFGYAPLLIGSQTWATTTSSRTKVTQTYTEAGATSGKVTGAVTTNEQSSTTHSGDQLGAFVTDGVTSFTLGARYQLTDSLGIAIEGYNQVVGSIGQTGLNAGIHLAY